MCEEDTDHASSKLSHDFREGQPVAIVPSPPNMIYESRATMERVIMVFWTGAARESTKMLQAATKEVEVTMTTTDSVIKSGEHVQERVCS